MEQRPDVDQVRVGRGRSMRLLLAVVGVVCLSWPGPAAAHVELDTIDPADQSSVDRLPEAVQLTFTEAVTLPTSVSVVGPSGEDLAAGRAAALGDRVVQQLSGDPAQGTFTVRWQVTSADGHLVSGTSSFTVGDAGGAAGSATDAATTHEPVALSLGLGVLVLLCVAAAGATRLARGAAGG